MEASTDISRIPYESFFIVDKKLKGGSSKVQLQPLTTTQASESDTDSDDDVEPLKILPDSHRSNFIVKSLPSQSNKPDRSQDAEE
jgi:hypothetical protein